MGGGIDPYYYLLLVAGTPPTQHSPLQQIVKERARHKDFALCYAASPSSSGCGSSSAPSAEAHGPPPTRTTWPFGEVFILMATPPFYFVMTAITSTEYDNHPSPRLEAARSLSGELCPSRWAWPGACSQGASRTGSSCTSRCWPPLPDAGSRCSLVS